MSHVSHVDKLEQARKRMIRWRIMKTLDIGRPLPIGEGLMLEVINDADLELTITSLKRALQYLEGKDYINLKTIKTPGDHDHVEISLSSKGIDFVEGSIEDDPGITRPDIT